MHVRELIELGAIVAAHGDVFMQHTEMPIKPHIEEYWVASRSRQLRWQESIKVYRRPRKYFPDSRSWFAIRPVIEEILASELLTRVWGAVACARDHCQGTHEHSPIVRSVLVGHLEARNRVLNVMVYGDGFTVEEGVVLNRLRRHVERWTDMLIGFLMKEHDVSEFAFNAQRSRDFASDLEFESGQASSSQSAQMIMASLRAAFQTGLSVISPNADLNQRIASSIFACFQHQLFDSTGTFKSLWMLRLSQVTDETAGLIDDLIQVDSIPNRNVSLRR